MLDRLEHLVVDVVDRVMKSPYAAIVQELNPVSGCAFSSSWLDIIFGLTVEEGTLNPLPDDEI